MMRCSRCGTEVQPGLTNCPSCGASTEPSPPPPPPGQPAPHPQYAQYPQYPQYAAPVPAQQGSTPGKVIIIVVVVLICILAAAAIVFFLFLGAVEDITSVEEEKVTLNLASPIVVQRDIDGTPHWDASFNVNKITPRDSGLGWSDVRVVVKSNIGSVLLTTTRMLVDNPSAYDDASDGTVDVEVWFVDADGDGLLEASDTLKLTGLTADYEGAQFEVLRSGERIASSSMPTDFG